jgi:GMP synthase (glutamine-hydrolysing)
LKPPLDRILVLDFGGQTTQLIARRVREQGVYCEIHPYRIGLDQIRAFSPKGIILSGGPASVGDAGAPTVDPGVFDLGIPVLGICYGEQLMAKLLGGVVTASERREFGAADVEITEERELFHGFKGKRLRVWMSHGDRVERLPDGFASIGSSAGSPFAAIAHSQRPLYGVQFHPEVVHTPDGAVLLGNFVRRVCGCRADWNMASYLEQVVPEIRAKVGGGRVMCALSGGVDSAVAAVLVHQAVGDQLQCIFVDTGMLRTGEAAQVKAVFERDFKLKLKCVDASARFLAKLEGVTDPETKRKRIGAEFIEVFEAEATATGGADFLVQGTLYPDVIESVSVHGPSASIKSHHNVGGLPERLRFKLLEPLRELFKDEVRALGRQLRIPEAVLQRQPFPGPGLAIRILGAVTPNRLALVRAADVIVQEEMAGAKLDRPLWQAFAVLLPVQSVGVMGDSRTYESTCVLRAVESQDGMTADWARLPPELLARISNRITNEVRGINRVVYDISSKPPATIEWE